jgi:hypothetical protein
MTRRRVLLPLLVCCMLAVHSGCDNDFSPKTEFERKLVVYAAFEPTLQMQVVRLAWSYDARLALVPEPLTPVEVTEAEVALRVGGTQYAFRDTVLTGDEGKPVHAWISRDIRFLHEVEYRLDIRVPEYQPIMSSVTAPSRMYLSAEAVRADTGDGWVRLYSTVRDYKVRPGAFYFRAWVVVNVRVGGTLVERRAEVPLRIDGDSMVYPSPQREDELRFDVRHIRFITNSLISQGGDVVSERFMIKGYVMNVELYNYYKIVRGFDDPVSMRLDRPDVSFIDGALGVFGLALPDSASWLLSRFVK